MLPGVMEASGTELAYDHAGARLLVATLWPTSVELRNGAMLVRVMQRYRSKGDAIVQIGESPNVGNDNDAVTATVQ